MARKLRHAALESRSARLKLALRLKPYSGPSLARGIKLMYRRNQGAGSWVLKASDGHGKYWTQAFAIADDFEESDGKAVLTFYEAQDEAKQLARRQPSDTGDDSRPTTVAEALDAYERELRIRGADIKSNVMVLRRHLSSTLLSKPIQLLGFKELRGWRDSLLDKGLKPNSIHRYCSSLSAALNATAVHDPRIASNRTTWKLALEAMPGASVARNVILSDDQVRALVAAGYAYDPQLGLLIHTLAETGTRTIQAARLTVGDLHGGAKPRLSMPRSGKGGTHKNRVQRMAERFSVPITEELFAGLQAAAAGRASDAPLLMTSNGRPWGPKLHSAQYYKKIRRVIASIGLDPRLVTPYALRHSSIVRQLKLNVPIRVVAATHDNSVVMIESHYSKFITEHSDDLTRAALLRPNSPAGDTVMPFRRKS
jgi:integrase